MSQHLQGNNTQHPHLNQSQSSKPATQPISDSNKDPSAVEWNTAHISHNSNPQAQKPRQFPQNSAQVRAHVFAHVYPHDTPLIITAIPQHTATIMSGVQAFASL